MAKLTRRGKEWKESLFISTDALGGDSERVVTAQQIAQQERVLYVVSDRLTHEEKENLNEPLLLSELWAAVESMANNKCPGPDGIRVKFFKCLWRETRPLLLQVLTEGLSDERFPLLLIWGLIVLLPKKAD